MASRRASDNLRLDSAGDEPTAESPMRFDLAGLTGRAQRTPQGFLRAPAWVTRVGVFPYRRADGTVQRELRLPEEVFGDLQHAGGDQDGKVSRPRRG